MDLLTPPASDPARWFQFVRAGLGSQTFVAALAHFRVFDLLSARSRSAAELQTELKLTDRAASVLWTALLAMGVITRRGCGHLAIHPDFAPFITVGSPHYLGDYFSQSANDAAVVEMAESFRRSAAPTQTVAGPGAAYVFRQGLDSAMDRPDSARELTLRLAGRARVVAPILAHVANLAGVGRLLDVGAGSGIFSAALLQANPGLRVTALERPEVLRVAAEFAVAAGVSERFEGLPGDMFTTPWPTVDAVLLSNVLHDWDQPECRQLIHRAARALRPGGRLLVHDAFLDDDLCGPLPVALYSIALFVLTEGRNYSRAEVAGWMDAEGLEAGPVQPTLVDCSLLEGRFPCS